MKDIHTVERPREKLIKLGADRLSNVELLAILINTGVSGKNTLEISQQILEKYTLENFCSLTFPELVKLPSIKHTKACQILAAKELFKRTLKYDNSPLEISDPQTVALLLSDLKKQKKEHLVVLYLNVQNELIHRETISIGIVNSSLIHPREVFEPAIKYLASAIILAHNHPSGSLNPSTADIEITKQITDSGRILGIEVLDHLIISSQGYASMKDLGLLDLA